jgi:hypothetical protein
MEQRHEKPTVPEPRTEDKPKRFRLVKLEERIAPKKSFSSGGEGHSGLVSIE